MSASSSPPTAVRISYNTLVTLYSDTANSGSLSNKVSCTQVIEREKLDRAIENAFGNGQDALGVIVIEDLPSHFLNLRSNLLHLAYKFAKLPEVVREKYAREEVQFMFGWSHGKEIMNGKPDIHKGSFYANPLQILPNVSHDLKLKYPVYYGENIWPDEEEMTGYESMKGFENGFKALGVFIYDVGILLARACERFVSPHMPSFPQAESKSSWSSDSSSSTTIANLISSSRCNKARLLHYFPASSANSNNTEGTPVPVGEEDVDEKKEDVRIMDDACGIHLDHSLLTGLCSAMYIRTSASGEKAVVPPPDDTAGLWICPRRQDSKPVKVDLPEDCLAFQTGEALHSITGGKLAATPHFVRSGKNSSDVSRETFAFFLQPDVDRVISPNGETFGQFSERILNEHYEQAAK